jgi:hypothetical protein
MTFASIRVRARRRGSLAWLLTVMLLLPVAQWVATSHTLRHLAAVTASDYDQRPAHLPGSCDICVVAAALAGAAPQSAPVLVLLPRLPEACPPVAPATSASLLFSAPYRSRAPPFLPA